MGQQTQSMPRRTQKGARVHTPQQRQQERRVAAVRVMLSWNVSRLLGRRPCWRQQRCATSPSATQCKARLILAVQPVTHHTIYTHMLHDAQTCKPGSVHRLEAATSPCLVRSCLSPAQELRSIQAALAARPQEAAAAKKQRPKKERPGTHSNYMPGMRMSAAAR